MDGPMEVDAAVVLTGAEAALKKLEATYDRVQHQLDESELSRLPTITPRHTSDEAVDILTDALSNLSTALTQGKAAKARFNHNNIVREMCRLDPTRDQEPQWPTDQVVAWWEAWKFDYQDNMGFRLFKERVKLDSTKPDIYARVLPVVQSSGTGKSRMLDEVAKSLFTFPFCLRPPGVNGYPKGDEDVWNLLCASPRNQYSTAFFHHFLINLFQMAQSMIKTSAPAESDVPSWWYAEMDSPETRKSFYSTVCQATLAVLATAPKETDTLHQMERAVETVRLAKRVGKALADLNALVGSGPVLLNFDEAHFLTSGSPPVHSGLGVAGLMSAMADLAQFPKHLVVLTSTATKLSSLAPAPGRRPSNGEEPSERFYATAISTLPQPFTTLSFNLFKLRKPGAPPLCPSQVRSLEIAAKLGRPLWGGCATKSLLKFASRKLTIRGATLPVPGPEAERPIASPLSASLTCRLNPGVQRISEASAFAAELVRNRMAVAMFVPQHREWLAACFPIDPILAWAAFEVCALNNSEAMLDELTRMTDSALIERGPRGELITKFVLMRAYDRAVQANPIYATPFNANPLVRTLVPFCPATLASFLEALGAPEDVLQTKAADGKTLLSNYGQSKLVLAQWIGAIGGEGGYKKVDVDMATQAALYSCGIEMPIGMPGVDHMLVFTLNDDRPLNKDNLLVIFTQTKNRIASEHVATPRKIIGDFTTEGVPVVFIVHEISLERGESFSFQVRPIERISRRRSLRLSLAEPLKTDTELDGEMLDLAWGFDMNGTNPALVSQESIVLLAAAQSQPFGSSGDADPQAILQMLPMLDNCPSTRAQTLGRTGILPDLVPSHLPQPA